MVIFAAIWGIRINRDGGIGLVAIVGDGRTDTAVATTIEEEELT